MLSFVLANKSSDGVNLDDLTKIHQKRLPSIVCAIQYM